MNATEREQLYAKELGPEALARQRRASAPKCRSCLRPMRWVTVSTTNRKMPVDYDPHEDGNVVVYANDRADVYRDTPSAVPNGATLHFSHFATCPNADEHRKSR
jgi:hypothetical protein